MWTDAHAHPAEQRHGLRRRLRREVAVRLAGPEERFARRLVVEVQLAQVAVVRRDVLEDGVLDQQVGHELVVLELQRGHDPLLLAVGADLHLARVQSRPGGRKRRALRHRAARCRRAGGSAAGGSPQPAALGVQLGLREQRVAVGVGRLPPHLQHGTAPGRAPPP
jgi:hypothetical protein